MTKIENHTKPYVVPEHTGARHIIDNINLHYRRDVEKLNDNTLAAIAYEINRMMEDVGQNPDDWRDLGRKHGYVIDDMSAWTDPIVDIIEDGRAGIRVGDKEEFATEILYAALPGDPELRGCSDIVGRLREEK